MSEHMILQGTRLVPVDLMTWAQWLESPMRHVGRTVVANTFVVSTVCLGLDHGWIGRPKWFETMVHTVDVVDSSPITPGKMHSHFFGYQERYTTYREAEIGHARVVGFLRKQHEANG